MENINIRQFEEKDKSAVSKLFEISLKYFSEIDPLDIIQVRPNYGKWSVENMLKKTTKEGTIFVADLQDKVVGFVAGSIKPFTEEEQMELKPIRYGTIEELHVYPEFQNQGIGTKLINMIEEYFKENNCEYSKLYVFDSNINAKRRYENLNYKTRINMMIKKI